MRSLIRPFLFAVARFGLFLAVAAWIAGQWLKFEFVVCGIPGTIFSQGMELSYSTIDLSEFECSARARSNNESVGPLYWLAKTFFEASEPVDLEEWGMTEKTFPGGVVRWDQSVTEFGMRHWFATSIFFAFNLFLHFIYHERPEAEPCED